MGAGGEICGDVAGDAVFDFLQDGDGGADLAGGAVAALEAVVLYKGGLHGVHVVRGAEALDGGDFMVLLHDGEGEAGDDAAAIYHDGAGTALALIAPFLAAGEVEVLAEGIKEVGAGIDLEVAGLAIDGEGHLDGGAGAGEGGGIGGGCGLLLGEELGAPEACGAGAHLGDEFSAGGAAGRLWRWLVHSGGVWCGGVV